MRRFHSSFSWEFFYRCFSVVLFAWGSRLFLLNTVIQRLWCALIHSMWIHILLLVRKQTAGLGSPHHLGTSQRTLNNRQLRFSFLSKSKVCKIVPEWNRHQGRHLDVFKLKLSSTRNLVLLYFYVKHILKNRNKIWTSVVTWSHPGSLPSPSTLTSVYGVSSYGKMMCGFLFIAMYQLLLKKQKQGIQWVCTHWIPPLQ